MRRKGLLCSTGEPPVVEHTLSIVGPSEVSGESAKFNFIYDGESVLELAEWSILSGSQYATIDEDYGVLTLNSGISSATVRIMCSYSGLNDYKEITCTYESGKTIETDTQTIIDEVTGDSITTVTEVVTNSDGTIEETSTTTTMDENGNLVGTSESEKTTQDDGSYTQTTTNYDPNGTAISTQNTGGDTEGNVSTQEIKYDSEGEPVVTGYTIDTTGSEYGEKNFNEDGVNTDFYAFDMTQGFILNMHFTIDFKNQPQGQNQNHHNILTMKRATPTPWYGFMLRQTGTTESIILGTQFATGSNNNKTINPSQSQSGSVSYEYNIEIVYDPTIELNNFVCRELISDTTVLQVTNVFPDEDDLKYLRVCIGYAMDENGEPYRYSNINVINFSIQKLTHKPETPEIQCVENVVSISCGTPGATIYYRLNRTGSYMVYNSSFTIDRDTIVQAYALLTDEMSDMAAKTCRYYNGVYEPIISCDGEIVTIVCETTEADIHYRIGDSGNYALYENPFSISSTVTVYSYALLEGIQSPIATKVCTYSPIILDDPVISCDGKRVTITCDTPNAVIHYRCNREGSFLDYSTPFQISASTFVEAYTTLNSKTSSVVTENCIYDPSHDYSEDYLTFKVLTNGTISWVMNGTGFARTIQYSKSGGEWTAISPTADGTYIDVVAGDIVRFKGTNTSYCSSAKANYSGFGGTNSCKGTAYFEIEGNIMSLLYGDDFVGQTTLTGDYTFQQLFKYTHAVSAEHLILPAMTLRRDCYRAMFSWASDLIVPPALPATTLATDCYYYMFESTSITTAPDLLATTLANSCYYFMFKNCSNLNYIKCLATNISASGCLTSWVDGVASSGTFVKDGNMTSWTRGISGIPTNWIVQNDSAVLAPVVSYDGFAEIELTCETEGATIYYRLGQSGNFSEYSSPITISSDTIIEAYSTLNGNTSTTTSQMCIYVDENDLIVYSNRDLTYWTHNGQMITTPYSINAVDGHSSSYAKGTFNFETTVYLRGAEGSYLWFQHADQSATIFVNNNLVEKHWGGYNAFFVDVTNYVTSGSNTIRVALKNDEGNNLAPAAGDFNFNATLGNAKFFTSPCLPDMSYGYDGMHISADVSDSSATIYVKTKVPSGADVACYIDEGDEYGYTFSDTKTSDGNEMTFIATIPNPHLWNGISDPYMYNVSIEISFNGDMYHSFWRPYGLRYYDYVYNDTTVVPGETYTGFLLNGQPYLLRGVCMHDDIDGKANALSQQDIYDEFDIIQELGCNFIRLAHYPHPKEVYDMCDERGIIVQTEAPCVNKFQSTLPSDYYTHLEGQYRDMVNQHFNHPCIMFWGLSNETTTDDKSFAKTKIESYTSLIKSIDQERWVGYVMSHSFSNPSSYYNNPNVDWFGCNIYVGWYIDKALNDPTNQLNTRVRNIITTLQKPMAFSEYGAGGTQHCHSDDPQTTTTKGNYERHDIEYQMWLHEGHIAAIRNFPQLLFSAQWQLFDIAVANRNEGYTECLDGETTSVNDNLRRLNNKGLVERDHTTKKDTFYIYKAEWNKTDLFVHICGKDYTKMTERVIKCYTNDPGWDDGAGDCLFLYVNGTQTQIAEVIDNIAVFTADNYSTGDVIVVEGGNSSDTFTF